MQMMGLVLTSPLIDAVRCPAQPRQPQFVTSHGGGAAE